MIVAMRADHHRALLDDVLLNQFTAVVRQDLIAVGTHIHTPRASALACTPRQLLQDFFKADGLGEAQSEVM